MAGDWRISPEERAKYESYFQQCSPVQGYLSGEQARDFFFKSNLPGEILRKIWDLADVTADGRLDKREFAIACYLIASQVQKKGPLPNTLPPSLLSDVSISSNGLPAATTMPTTNVPSQPASLASSMGLLSKAPVPTTVPINTSLLALTPASRSKYLQQFHSLVDVSKTNGFMTGLQAKNVLQQTGLSYILLHHIWNLADHDKDGRLTADEFVVAMHCCEIVRAGQTLPTTLPDDWLSNTRTPPKSTTPSSFASLNQQLKETFGTGSATPPPNATPSAGEMSEAEQKAAHVTYEEKRLKNYEDGNKELERRRQLLREQEEREQREREERERKRESELQKQREEQERKKQQEIERQLEKQRQIEQQKEEERRKLYEQREAARKELERKNRLEWERQRMQELSTQKSRLLEQINDLKSREKAMELELQSMDDTMQTCQMKIDQTNTIVHSLEESLADLQRNIETERSQLETAENRKKESVSHSTTLQSERESLNSALNELQQSIEFGTNNREADQIKLIESQIEAMKDENSQTDEQIQQLNERCKEYQKQMEDLRQQFDQLEQEARAKKPPSVVTSPTTTTPSASFANFDQFNAQAPVESPVQPTAVSDISPSIPVVDVDPFQTVDPFAFQPGSATSPPDHDWFHPRQQDQQTAEPDPFQPVVKPVASPPSVVPSSKGKAAPKAPTQAKPSAPVDPWGASTQTTSNNGHDWAQFSTDKNIQSPFEAQKDWAPATGLIQYRVLFDYTPERPDEMAIAAGDIITVDPSKQQDDHWLFGQVGQDQQGFFPAAYTELITTGSAVTTPTSNEAPPTVDTTSQLQPGSIAITLADHQGKTVDKHLSFKKGETIIVRSQKDAAWYTGQLHGKVGWFPRNYVRPATEVEVQNTRNSAKNTPTSEKSLSSPMATNGNASADDPSTEVYEAIYAYEATDPSDLSFDVGERIVVSKREGDWWTGQVGDRTGTFPYNYVQKIDHANGVNGTALPATHETPPTATTPKSDVPRYIAIFPYDAQQEDELSFPADAILEILDQTTTTGWFKAKLGEQVGLIPSTYVQAMDAPPPT